MAMQILILGRMLLHCIISCAIGITHNYREFGTTELETALTILRTIFNDTAMFILNLP
jgi:hypothetical protein